MWPKCSYWVHTRDPRKLVYVFVTQTAVSIFIHFIGLANLVRVNLYTWGFRWCNLVMWLELFARACEPPLSFYALVLTLLCIGLSVLRANQIFWLSIRSHSSIIFITDTHNCVCVCEIERGKERVRVRECVTNKYIYYHYYWYYYSCCLLIPVGSCYL